MLAILGALVGARSLLGGSVNSSPAPLVIRGQVAAPGEFSIRSIYNRDAQIAMSDAWTAERDNCMELRGFDHRPDPADQESTYAARYAFESIGETPDRERPPELLLDMPDGSRYTIMTTWTSNSYACQAMQSLGSRFEPFVREAVRQQIADLVATADLRAADHDDFKKLASDVSSCLGRDVRAIDIVIGLDRSRGADLDANEIAPACVGEARYTSAIEMRGQTNIDVASTRPEIIEAWVTIADNEASTPGPAQ